jgi:hypothetical protein
MKVKLFDKTFELKGSIMWGYYFEPEDLSYLVKISNGANIELSFYVQNKLGLINCFWSHVEYLNLRSINYRRKNTLNLTRYLQDELQLITFCSKYNLNLINKNYGILL